MIQRLTNSYFNADRWKVLGLSLLLFAVIAFGDAAVSTVSLGLLYLLPIVVSSGFLARKYILLIALASTGLQEVLSYHPYWDWETLVRVLRSFAGFALTGVLTSEVARRRRVTHENVSALEKEIALREEAQEQLSVLIDTSPAAILITDEKGVVLRANESAEELLEFAPGTLAGEKIHRYLPAIETVPVGGRARSLRSTLECRGQRRSGAVFMAQIWFSTFQARPGPRVAAIVLDASQDLRERDGAGLDLLMRTSRILIGAVSHSVRNLCAASRISYGRLSRMPELAGNEDLKALGTLVRGLESISSANLERTTERSQSTVDVKTLVDELRVVVEPSFHEAGIELTWDVPDALPGIWGDHYGLLHALLNLVQNSERALRTSREKRLRVSVQSGGSGVDVLVTDTGGGVARPEDLFQAFTPGATGAGLGLYVSRAIVRSCDGDLTYEAVPGGSCFRVSLLAAYNRRAHAANQF